MAHRRCAPKQIDEAGLLLLLLVLLRWHVLLGDDGHDLAKHDGGVAVEEGNAREALAVLEGIDDERLLRAERDLRHLVGLERVGRLHLLAASLLADLENESGRAACGAAAPDEANRRVADLDLAGDVEGLDLRVELAHLVQRLVLLVDHHVADAGHVDLVEALDVEADVVARLGNLVPRVVHLDGEYLARASVGRGVGGHEDHLLVGLHEALLDAARQHIADTLDLVDAGDGHAHRRGFVAAGRSAHVVEAVVQGVDVQLLLVGQEDVLSRVPVHVGRLLIEVVAHPSRDREHRR
mmetsp:Transcript_2663/g.8904  ORF Transcript_2663/g.8904 Transcript_2663/m.8904 type:complete len:295 (+) Transcript_2663:210-1094(+)